MEALTAISLAGNVVQFVGFLSELLSEGKEIYSSVEGSSQRMLELERTYQSLSHFTNILQQSTSKEDHGGSSSYTQDATAVSSHTKALNALSEDCHRVCLDLLRTVRKLQVKGGSRQFFSSFKIALKVVWKKNEILDLEERLERMQRTLSLHFYPILRYVLST